MVKKLGPRLLEMGLKGYFEMVSDQSLDLSSLATSLPFAHLAILVLKFKFGFKI